MRRILLSALLLLLSAAPAGAGSPGVTVYAAGSLRGVMTALAKQFQEAHGIAVNVTFGPSGLLRKRIQGGERPDILTSADMASPEALAREGLALPTILYARNALCATGRDKLGLTTENLLETLLDPAVRLGTSTPKADPAGDYAWAMFAKTDAVKPGSRQTLEAKADKIVGGAHNSAPVRGKHPVAAAFEDGKIDVFLGYCSGNLPKSVPGLVQVPLPADLSVAASYGMAVRKDAGPDARLFALFLVSEDAQKIFRDFGFVPVGLP
ncbi:molybdate ABC transporter substrate-binding protein [Solidesulfovibrio sp. C21]|uniref:molybdate ABC transporter substrate-binding protein n=1 Tax=Solidesulfovibrio sp. C21 TaxID=3398613 RepID=UPI0039FD4F6D